MKINLYLLFFKLLDQLHSLILGVYFLYVRPYFYVRSGKHVVSRHLIPDGLCLFSQVDCVVVVSSVLGACLDLLGPSVISGFRSQVRAQHVLHLVRGVVDTRSRLNGRIGELGLLVPGISQHHTINGMVEAPVKACSDIFGKAFGISPSRSYLNAGVSVSRVGTSSSYNFSDILTL